jgi:hypothetical protein
VGVPVTLDLGAEWCSPELSSQHNARKAHGFSGYYFAVRLARAATIDKWCRLDRLDDQELRPLSRVEWG